MTNLLTVLNADVQPFEQITALTDVAEGTVVRVITRLDETCREVRDAARVIGDADLMKKMEEAQIKIKRDSESRLLFFCTVGVILTGLMQLYSLLACISECILGLSSQCSVTVCGPNEAFFTVGCRFGTDETCSSVDQD